MTHDPVDEAWLDAVLNTGRPAAIADDGFSDGVLARIAFPSPMLLPQAALAALRQAERSERRRVRWTFGATIVGATVAAATAWLAGAPVIAEAPLIGANVVALLAVSCSLAWLAIANRHGICAW